MIIPLLEKLFFLIIERQISHYLEDDNKMDKGQVGFMDQHATTYHLATLKVIIDDHRDKT